MAGVRSAGAVADFCAGLRQLRAGSKMPVAVLAGRLGISRQHLHEVLAGRVKRPPDWDEMVAPLVRGVHRWGSHGAGVVAASASRCCWRSGGFRAGRMAADQSRTSARGCGVAGGVEDPGGGAGQAVAYQPSASVRGAGRADKKAPGLGHDGAAARRGVHRRRIGQRSRRGGAGMG